jgi:hypothetical protein
MTNMRIKNLNTILALCGLFITLVWLISLAVHQTPAVLLHDELGHLLVARDAWHHPSLIFNNWGRTINTLLYMPIAGFSLLAARLWSIALTLITSWLTWDVTRRLNFKYAGLTPFFLLFQRHFLEVSWMSITEVPFTLAIMLTLWLSVRRRWRWAGTVAGLFPLIRQEGIVLSALFGMLCLVRRDVRAFILVLTPMVLNNGLAWLLFRYVPLRIYFQPQPTTFYGAGGFNHFVMPLLLETGLPIAALALLGSIQALSSAPATLYMLANLVYFATHSLIYRFGLYASGGYSVFLYSLAPCFAMLAVAGVELTCERIPLQLGTTFPSLSSIRKQQLITMLILVGTLCMALNSGRKHSHVEVDHQERAIDAAIAYLRNNGLEEAPVMSTHVWFFYHMPRSIPNVNDSLWLNTRDLKTTTPGTLALWDAKYGNIFGLPRDYFDNGENGWKKIWSSDEDAILYRKE